MSSDISKARVVNIKTTFYALSKYIYEIFVEIIGHTGKSNGLSKYCFTFVCVFEGEIAITSLNN